MTAGRDRAPTTVAQSPEDLRLRIKEYLVETLAHLFKYNGLISIGVSGGSMPKIICDALKSIENLEWKRIRLFMVDERFVPLTDPDSNYGQYLSHLPAEYHQYIVPVEMMETTTKTALQYEVTLKASLCPEQIGRLPRFDILFLGIGPDGHTCSLFPGHRLLKADTLSWVIAIDDSPKPPSKRVTLTLAVLNAAKNVAFIATGDDKATVVKSILERDPQYPCSLVRPFNNKLRFFLDKGSASKL
uniref:6-phosphogluconolactonase n=1 Tax=Heterorhabditis bacteriophora TaxID=37862 RepID=A0A1I7XGE6_HETBA